MKKFSFALICTVMFFGGALSVFKYGRGGIADSTISYFVDISLQLLAAGIFSAVLFLWKRKQDKAISFFKFGCIVGIFYTAIRCAESIINAKNSGLDNIPAIPIMGVTGIIFSAVFVYFFMASSERT